jgi:hypothetical protein
MSEYQPGTPGSDDGASSLVGQAQEKVQETAHHASSTAARAVREQVETRAAQTSDELRSVAGAMRRSGHALHADGNERPAQIVDTVAEKLEGVAGYLAGSGGDAMLHDLERFGRRKPWAMVGAGLGLGFVASRFLKASSRARFATSQTSPQVAPSRGITPPAQPVPAAPRPTTAQTIGGAPVHAR